MFCFVFKNKSFYSFTFHLRWKFFRLCFDNLKYHLFICRHRKCHNAGLKLSHLDGAVWSILFEQLCHKFAHIQKNPNKKTEITDLYGNSRAKGGFEFFWISKYLDSLSSDVAMFDCSKFIQIQYYAHLHTNNPKQYPMPMHINNTRRMLTNGCEHICISFAANLFFIHMCCKLTGPLPFS